MDNLLLHNQHETRHGESRPGGATVMWVGLTVIAIIFFGAILFVSHKPDKQSVGVAPKVKVQTLPTVDANISAGRDAPTRLMRGQYYTVVEMEEAD